MIDISWQTRIEVTGDDPSIVLSGLEIPHGLGFLNEIIITPVSVLTSGTTSSIWGNGAYYSPPMNIALYTHDGNRINVQFESGGGFFVNPELWDGRSTNPDDLRHFDSHSVPMGVYILDLHDIAAIEILGQIIHIPNIVK